MKYISERLAERGIEARTYSGFAGNDNYELETKIREEFGNPFLRWAKAQTDSLTYSLPLWGINTITKKRDMTQPEPSNGGSHLVLVVHGLGEHGRMFDRFKKDAAARGYTAVPISYNDKKDFKDYTKDVSDELKRLTDESSFFNVYALGHSTGADILRVINSENGLDDFSGVVLASPTSNGHVPGLKEKILFGKKCEYHNPSTVSGRKNIDAMQTPLNIPGITVAYLNDFLVPLNSSLDMTGENLIVANYGHVTGTGEHRIGNTIYIESLREIS